VSTPKHLPGKATARDYASRHAEPIEDLNEEKKVRQKAGPAT
jgi:hypothetical protein